MASKHLSLADDVLRLWKDSYVRTRLPVKPAAHEEFAREPSLPVGPDYLCHLFRRILARTSPEHRGRLRSCVATRLNHVFNMGTACSGTDGPVLATQALAKVLLCDCDCRLDIEQRLASKKEPSKKRFLQSVRPALPKIFSDAMDLGSHKAYDALSGRMQPVDDDLDGFLAGFLVCGCVSIELRVKHCPEPCLLVDSRATDGISVSWVAASLAEETEAIAVRDLRERRRAGIAAS